MTGEQAMEEIWGGASPNCGPQDYEFIVLEVAELGEELDRLRALADGRR